MRPLALQVDDGARLFPGRAPALLITPAPDLAPPDPADQQRVALADDGRPPDAFASDGIWSGLVSVDPTLPLSVALAADHLPEPLALPSVVRLDPASASLSLALRYTGAALQQAESSGPTAHDPTPVQIISAEGALVRGALLAAVVAAAIAGWLRWSVGRLIAAPAVEPLRLGAQVLPARGLIRLGRDPQGREEDLRRLLDLLCPQGRVLLVGPPIRHPYQAHLWRLRPPQDDPAKVEPGAVAAAIRYVGVRAVILAGACPRVAEIASAAAVPVIWLAPEAPGAGGAPGWGWPG